MEYANYLAFGIYPYVALGIFLLGSLIRFDREQYTWKSDSSQLLRSSQLRWGSNLFHIGILFLFFGHAAGLLTPHWLYESLGLSTMQMLAIIGGGGSARLAYHVAACSAVLRNRASAPPASQYFYPAGFRNAGAGFDQHPVLAATHRWQRDAAARRLGAAHRNVPRRCGRLPTDGTADLQNPSDVWHDPVCAVSFQPAGACVERLRGRHLPYPQLSSGAATRIIGRTSCQSA